MAFTISSVVSISTLVVSIILIALASTNFYLVSHGTQLMDYWFPAGKYEWWTFRYFEPSPMGPVDSGHKVWLRYDTATETQILVSTGFTIAAGVLGVITFAVTRKYSKSTVNLTTTGTALITSTLAFLTSIICLIMASVKHDNLAGGCKARFGNFPDYYFRCTRELTACGLLQTRDGGITETNWADNRRCCRETKGARLMLIPFVILSFGLVVLYAAKLFLGNKQVDGVSADERVERLERDSE